MGMLLPCLAFVAACSRQGQAGAPTPSGEAMAAPVTAATVTTQAVPVELRAIGNVEAY
jgi:hypothetical protein